MCLSNQQQKESGIVDFTELEKTVIPGKTKMIIINNPLNPLGKVWIGKKLVQIAELATKHNLLVIADEVYETLVYSDSKSPMIKFASLPGMYQRTITVGSMGKIFGVTGWKVMRKYLLMSLRLAGLSLQLKSPELAGWCINTCHFQS